MNKNTTKVHSEEIYSPNTVTKNAFSHKKKKIVEIYSPHTKTKLHIHQESRDLFPEH